RPLYSQGPEAPGGAYDYIVKGHMIGGFALVGYPATHPGSGITPFIVSHDRTLYQKNLGPRTPHVPHPVETLHPDKTWTKIDARESARCRHFEGSLRRGSARACWPVAPTTRSRRAEATRRRPRPPSIARGPQPVTPCWRRACGSWRKSARPAPYAATAT